MRLGEEKKNVGRELMIPERGKGESFKAWSSLLSTKFLGSFLLDINEVAVKKELDKVEVFL